MSQPELSFTPADAKRDGAVAIICQYHDGLVTQDEMHDRLDMMKIRGAYSPRCSYATGVKPAEFVGYDYAAQRWLRITL